MSSIRRYRDYQGQTVEIDPSDVAFLRCRGNSLQVSLNDGYTQLNFANETEMNNVIRDLAEPSTCVWDNRDVQINPKASNYGKSYDEVRPPD